MGIVVLSFLLISVLVFTGLFLLFKKYSSGKSPLSNLYYWLTAFFVTPSLYVVVLLVWFLLSSTYERKPFNQEQWTESRDSRYVYVDDLVDGNKLIGLTSTELKSLLGEADFRGDTTVGFYIGYSPQYLLNMDPDWLEADLIDGKVTAVRIRE